MKKHGKKIIAAILTASMVLSMAVTAFADPVVAGEDVEVIAEEVAAEEAELTEEDAAVADEIVLDEAEEEAVSGIEAVCVEAFVDADGAKISKVVIAYGEELKAESIAADTFTVAPYDVLSSSKCELGAENVGKITDVKVDEDVVIITLNTDYQRGSVPNYKAAMSVCVTQDKDIQTADGKTIAASDKEVTNYTVTETTDRNGNLKKNYTAIDGTYEFADLKGFQLFTKEDGTAFAATNCFEEATGESIDVDLPYALYVPEGYHEGGKYGLVLQIHDAGTMGDDPMLTLTESQASSNFASAEVQQMAKEAGMDGLFVVAPMINNDLRSTRDNYTMSAAVPATWQLLDYLTEKYDIDMDRIFGTGQSMGGMQVIAMAAQRDNYFAGIWEHGCQWGSNYNKEEPYPERGGGFKSYFMSKDPTIAAVDDDGNDSDYGQNFYYLISDDNLLISNCKGDAFSTTVWREVEYLYKDIAGVNIPHATISPLTDSLEAQNATIDALVATENGGFGWYWYAYEGGSHMLTWVYGHKLDAGYEWLVNQKREVEHAREKCAQMNNEFVQETDPEKLAAKQTEERHITTAADGTEIYFAVPAENAGTKGYNGGWFNMNGALADDIHIPGWKVEAPEAKIAGIKVIAFVDSDGAKANAVAVEYTEDIAASSVSADDFAVESYDVIEKSAVWLGENPGAVTKVYVNDTAEVAAEGKEAGKFVIIELNADFQRNSVPVYTAAMAASVEQKGEIETAKGTKVAASEAISNYIVETVETTTPTGQKRTKKVYTVDADTYEITSIADFKLFTLEDGTAFHATDCFEEATGKKVDMDLPYALYVPEGYHEGGNYGLVLQIHDAGTMGTDPVLTLTESQASVNFASAEVQQMAKDAGMDGLFVLAPMIAEEYRSTRDNYTMSAAVPATWQLLDSITKEYNINMNRIFGTGQSMGGMQVIAMAAQRDNYFAGIWEHGCQWGSNYNKESEYVSRGSGAVYYPSDDATIWRTDDDGKDSDLGQNFYYLVSDDNLLITNCQGDEFSTTVWTEFANLYGDIAGVEIPYAAFDPVNDSIDKQNAVVDELVNRDAGKVNMYWYAYSGGSHMLTWVYGHRVERGYEWLVNQTRESEQERSKLAELANEWKAETDPAKLAAKQTEDRFLCTMDGKDFYFAVPAEGAGTKGYNSGWFSMGKSLNDADHYPGWQVKVSESDAKIVGVKTIGFVDLEGAKVKAIVLEYDKEIDGASVGVDSYEVTNYTTFCVDKLGASQIEADNDGIAGNEGKVSKVYVNDKEEISEEGTATGKYVVIEVNTDYMLSGQNLSYTATMMGGATQVKAIKDAEGKEVPASEEEAGNYKAEIVESTTPSGSKRQSVVVEIEDGTIILPEFEEGTGWTLHYIEGTKSNALNIKAGEAFHATDAFSEYTGEYQDFDLPYSLFVPSDEVLEANKGNIALVIHMEHAGANDTDPMAAITSSRAAVKHAAIAASTSPAIVVVPQIEESRRSTNDYDASSEANTAIWELMDYLLEEYEGYINTDRIYGTGQSMGGMSIINMAAQRDNFFGGIAVIGAQWSNNYDKQFTDTAIRTPEADPIAFAVNGDQGFGHSVEWYNDNFLNWYYMVSDDNIFIHTCVGDAMAHGEWDDLSEYFAAAGVEIPYDAYDPHSPLAEQNAKDKELLNHATDTPGSGITRAGFTSGNHMSTWKYGYALDAPFEWLYQQTKADEDARGKVEALNNEYLGRDEEGKLLEGSGTKNMNSAMYTQKGKDATYPENWKPNTVTETMIAALGDQPKAADVEKARAKYEKLSEEEKALVSNYNDLLKAEGKQPNGLADSAAADGNWYYYVDGEIAKDVTTVAHNKNGWWYVENGKVDFNANTVAHNMNGWWVIENGKVNFEAEGVYHNMNGWWYCKGGKVDFNYNGFGSNMNGDWYCENGKVNFDVNDIIFGEVKGTEGWWYVVESKVTYGQEVVAQRKAYGWWFIGKDGKVDFNANTVAHNSNGWWFIKNGMVDFSYTGLGTNANGTWYIKDGKVDFSFNGTYAGKKIVNGKVQ